MNGRFVFISGSAGRGCQQDKLDEAIRLVTAFTGEVLRSGGGVVVLAGDEASTRDERGNPHIFDWVVLREVERFAGSTTESPHVYARVVMSDKAREAKIDEEGLRLLRNLEQRGVLEPHYIKRDLFTGGEYRQAMIERSDAMLAIGGGKGTYAAATAMTELGKPVLPLDLRLGSASDDGDGAVALHRERLSDPDRFFPRTHRDVVSRVGTLSLNRANDEAEAVARASVELLARELAAGPPPKQPGKGKGRLAAAWQAVKEASVVASIFKIVESVKGLFSFL